MNEQKTEHQIIWDCLKKLEIIFNDDMHGYRSEVYSAVSVAIDEVKEQADGR